MKTYRLKLFLLLFCSTSLLTAQTEKLNKSYKTDADVRVNVEAGHTNIIIENWGKNEVQVEAYFNGNDVSKEVLDSWNLKTSGNSNEINISSGGGVAWAPGVPHAPVPPIPPMQAPMAKLPEMMQPLMQDLVAPILENIAKNPLPPELFENMGELNFDYEAYQQEGDKYIKRWEKQVEKNFGKDFEKSMEAWAANFEKDSVRWKKNLESSMEEWGEEFGESMEAWGEQFEKNMEQWAEQMEANAEQMEAMEGQQEEAMERMMMINGDRPGATAKRTIKITVPRNTQLNLEVRHGEVKLGDATNLKADLSHSQFSAKNLDGKETKVSASYTPVRVQQWSYGELQASYVDKCVLNKVRSIKLSSNASDVSIAELQEMGILSGSFGNLSILKLTSGFDILDITVENSELVLNIPDAAFDFSFNGTQSNLEYPEAFQVKQVENYDSELINGYYKSGNNDATISIDARFSDVVLK